MQKRMQLHPLSKVEIENLLCSQSVGRLGTSSPNGFPYVVPVHFVYHEEKIYIHGLTKGQKIDNLKLHPKVCFEVDHMSGLILSSKPCGVNTDYRSVIIMGEAQMVEEKEKKECILNQIVDKYTPQLSGKELPERMISITSIIEITIIECSGKYYKQE